MGPIVLYTHAKNYEDPYSRFRKRQKSKKAPTLDT